MAESRKTWKIYTLSQVINRACQSIDALCLSDVWLTIQMSTILYTIAQTSHVSLPSVKKHYLKFLEFLLSYHFPPATAPQHKRLSPVVFVLLQFISQRMEWRLSCRHHQSTIFNGSHPGGKHGMFGVRWSFPVLYVLPEHHKVHLVR